MATRWPLVSPLVCGCALRSLGGPWVAQRVCPIPVVDGGSGRSASSLSRFAILPAFFIVVSAPSVSRATPAESYPRYSSLRRPSRTTSSACFDPTYPTIPHMAATLTPGNRAPVRGVSGGALMPLFAIDGVLGGRRRLLDIVTGLAKLGYRCGRRTG